MANGSIKGAEHFSRDECGDAGELRRRIKKEKTIPVGGGAIGTKQLVRHCSRFSRPERQKTT
jgi:hypothetical protein